ncbi:MAG: Glu/Leu/Phe/Val dehydrogenase dimerization domain-containing protein [Parvularculaceae bacterium]|nr:Glu/Leu/Phe/Val dehydrogenase dimerization domain-containing protein [Parvularculaceae bacterium]
MKTRAVPVEGWLKVVHFEEPESGLNALIAVHDATLGPACGGCRIRPYETFDAALGDVARLSRGMTYKNALGAIPFGGGKAVIIADPKTQKTEALLTAFGRAVESLGGLYYTAEDSGVTEHDLDIVRRETNFVAGVAKAGEGGNPSPFTASGVYRGIEAAARFKLGRETLDGLRVAILGVGAVGMALGERLHEAGARLVVADVNEAAVAKAVRRFGAVGVSPQDCIAADVDVFAPCALGGAINEETITRLIAPIVAGAANNQLATPEMDAALHAKGVLYAPDYVINAAGVISVGLEILGQWNGRDLNARIDRIGATLIEIFERSARENRPTGAIADTMAMDVIAKARRAA